jgi:hypothetical protein
MTVEGEENCPDEVGQRADPTPRQKAHQSRSSPETEMLKPVALAFPEGNGTQRVGRFLKDPLMKSHDGR